MKTNSTLILLTAFLACSVAQTPAPAQSTAPKNPTPADAAPTSNAAPLVAAPFRLPVYHPPGVTGGILPIRIGGGSRGSAADGVSVEVLVPDAIALTTKAQPSLYWYQSKTAKTDFEVTVTQPQVAKPLLVLKSSTAMAAGIHSIRLADFKVNLDPNVVYKWSVAVVVDPANRSADTIAYGVIKRIDPTPDLAGKLASASAAEQVSVYADAGIWYDALDTLSGLIKASPTDPNLRAERAGLLTQIGLKGDEIEKNALVK